MQRRDGEFMISFFKAAVNHVPGAEPSKPKPTQESADKDSAEIEGHIRESIHEAAEGHQHEAAEHVNASDAVAQRVCTCSVLPLTSFDSLHHRLDLGIIF